MPILIFFTTWFDELMKVLKKYWIGAKDISQNIAISLDIRYY
jgi:hypothetical protein